MRTTLAHHLDPRTTSAEERRMAETLKTLAIGALEAGDIAASLADFLAAAQAVGIDATPLDFDSALGRWGWQRCHKDGLPAVVGQAEFKRIMEIRRSLWEIAPEANISA